MLPLGPALPHERATDVVGASGSVFAGDASPTMLEAAERNLKGGAPSPMNLSTVPPSSEIADETSSR
jgi:hypothetical protein